MKRSVDITWRRKLAATLRPVNSALIVYFVILKFLARTKILNTRFLNWCLTLRGGSRDPLFLRLDFEVRIVLAISSSHKLHSTGKTVFFSSSLSTSFLDSLLLLQAKNCDSLLPLPVLIYTGNCEYSDLSPACI